MRTTLSVEPIEGGVRRAIRSVATLQYSTDLVVAPASDGTVHLTEQTHGPNGDVISRIVMTAEETGILAGQMLAPIEVLSDGEGR